MISEGALKGGASLKPVIHPYVGALTSVFVGRQEVRVLNHATWKPTVELTHPLTVEPAEGAFPHAIDPASLLHNSQSSLPSI